MQNAVTHPMAEAKVQFREVGTTEWRDSLDFDPIMIPVESELTTDVFNSTVIAISDAMISAEIDNGLTDYRLVWSDTEIDVKGLCPVCDDVFPVGEGAPGDELNEGYDAVFCGCDPADR